MDQTALSRLSEAFAQATKRKEGKPLTQRTDPSALPAVATKKKRRRGRRRKGDPLTETARLYRAQNQLAKILHLKTEPGSCKRLAASLAVSPLADCHWMVSGGECQHIVVQVDLVLVCTDHSPAHPRPKEGHACSHEVAVRRYLVQEILRKGGGQ